MVLLPCPDTFTRRATTLLLAVLLLPLSSGLGVATAASPAAQRDGLATAEQHTMGRSWQQPVPWPSFQGDEANSGHQQGALEPIDDPITLWDPLVALTGFGPILVDVSGNLKLANGTDAPPGGAVAWCVGSQMALRDARDGTLMWQVVLPAAAAGAPLGADLDADGRTELAVLTVEGQLRVYRPAMTYDGTSYVSDGNPQVDHLRFVAQPGASADEDGPKVIDLNADGTADLLAPADDALVAIDGAAPHGTLWNHTVLGDRPTTPAVLRQDGALLGIVIASVTIGPPNALHVEVLDAQGAPQWNRTLALGDPLPIGHHPSAALGDIDGDGEVDLVVVAPALVSGDGALWALDQSGAELWGGATPLVGATTAAPVLVNVSGDAASEVVVATSRSTGLGTSSRVSAINGSDGGPLWNHTIDRFPEPQTDGERLLGPLIAIAPGPGGAAQVLCRTDGGALIALNGSTGQERWSFEQGVTGQSGGIAAGDVTGDGLIDLALGSGLITQDIAALVIDPAAQLLSTATAEDGDALQLRAQVRNDGTRVALGVHLQAYDGYPEEVLPDGDVLVDLPPGSVVNHTFVFDAAGGGDHHLHVRVDPAMTIPQADRTDDEAVVILTVTSAFALAVDAQPRQVATFPGVSVSISATISNVGSIANVATLLWRDLPPGWVGTVEGGPFDLPVNGSIVVVANLSSPVGAGAQEVPLRLEARSTLHSSERARAELLAVVPRPTELLAWPDVAEVLTYREGFAVFDLWVVNAGLTNDTAHLGVSSDDSAWLFYPQVINHTLAPNGTWSISIIGRPPTDAADGETVSLSVAVFSEVDPSVVRYLSLRATVLFPDVEAVGLRLLRRDGAVVDDVDTHLVANRTFTVESTYRNTVPGLDTLQGIPLNLSLDGSTFLFTITEVAGSVATVLPFQHAIPTAGAHTVTLHLNAEGTMAELDGSNNQLQRSIEVRAEVPQDDYVVSGTVRYHGVPLADALVVIANERSLASVSLHTDPAGQYHANLSDLEGGYLEEDHIKVNATNGITTASVSFYAYSEDGGRTVDLDLVPGPFDFALGLDGNGFSALPGERVMVDGQLEQVGNGTNVLQIAVEGPQGWPAAILRVGTTPQKFITLSPGERANLSLELLVANGTTAGFIGQYSLLVTSLNDTTRRQTATIALEVRQRFGVHLEASLGPIHPGGTTSGSLHLQALGNGDETLHLLGTVGTGWSVLLTPINLTLAPTANATTALQVSAPAGIAPGSATLLLSATVEGTDPPVVHTLSVELQVVPFDFGVDVIIANPLTIAEPGDSRDFVVTIRNTGSGNETAHLAVVSSTGWSAKLLDGAALPWADVALEGGQSRDGLLRVVVPDEPMQRQSVLTISATLTDHPEISASENANVQVSAPDLELIGQIRIGGKVRATVPTGATTGVTLRVENAGNAAAFGVEVALLIDNTQVDGTTVDLPADEGAQVSLNWTPVVGTHNLTFIVNPTRAIKEFSYANNAQSIQVVVPAAGAGLDSLTLGIVAVLIVVVVVTLLLVLRRRAQQNAWDGTEEDDEVGEEEYWQEVAITRPRRHRTEEE